MNHVRYMFWGRVFTEGRKICGRIGQELYALGYVAAHYFSDLEKENPQAHCLVPGQPIILVHGILHNSSGWRWMRDRLKKGGFGPIFAINLPSTLSSIEKSSLVLRDFLASVSEMTGRSDLVLIGHSMGGLVALHCAADPACANVAKVITLASPLRGTWMGWALPFSASSMEMRRNSPFIQELAKRVEKKKDLLVFHLFGTMDLMVLPNRSGALQRTDPSHVYSFARLSHTSFLIDEEVCKILQKLLLLLR